LDLGGSAGIKAAEFVERIKVVRFNRLATTEEDVRRGRNVEAAACRSAR